jgi:hypothetical protein
MPADHPLARLKSAAPEALEREDIILLEDGHCLRDTRRFLTTGRPGAQSSLVEAFWGSPLSFERA